MDVLAIDGKNYVKSSVIARDLGYTTDYVGQLCRSGKVDARLFGRTWYVEKKSIGGHKSTRYRSTNAVTKKALHVHVASQEEDQSAVTKVQKSKFYSYSTQKPVARYTPDQSDLIPTVGSLHKTKGNLTVALAEATSVAIRSQSEKYNFTNPKLAAIHFKGKLQVTNFEDVSEPETANDTKFKDTGFHVHPKEVNNFKRPHVHKMAKNKVSSVDIIENSFITNDTPQTHEHSVPTHPIERTQVVVVDVASTKVWTLCVLFLALLISGCIALFLMALELRIDASKDSVAMNYEMDILEAVTFISEFDWELNFLR